jgi:hypothetical protein
LAALPIDSNAPGEIASTPGRSMISTPMKPRIQAVQRRARTISCRTNGAIMVANSGAVKLSATASPTGSSASALNHISVPDADRMPRTK